MLEKNVVQSRCCKNNDSYRGSIKRRNRKQKYLIKQKILTY